MRQCGEQAGKFTSCTVGEALSRTFHLIVVVKWLATPKRARYSALNAFMR